MFVCLIAVLVFDAHRTNDPTFGPLIREEARAEASAQFEAQLAAAADAGRLELEEAQRRAAAELESSKRASAELVARVQASAEEDAARVRALEAKASEVSQ